MKNAGLYLWQASNQWQRMQKEALEPLDLTHVQFILLAGVVELEKQGFVTQSALAAYAKADPMMTSQVLRALEKKGCVIRSAHPEDTRALQLVTTAKGRKLFEQAFPIVQQVDKDFFGKDEKLWSELLSVVPI